MNERIKSLVEDIYSLFDPKHTHTPDEKNLDEFAETIKNILRVRLSSREEVNNPLRFSSLGKPDRQLWMMAQGEKVEELTGKTYFKFLYGDIIEAMLVFLAKESGHEVTRQQEEVNVDGVLGHIDCVIDGVVVDVKSAAPYSYQKFINGSFHDDVFSKQYINQLCGYSNLLTPNEAPAFLVMDKVAGSLALVPVSTSIAKDFHPVERIAHLKEVISQPKPPPICYADEPEGQSGNRKLSTGCSYCGFKKRCWPGVRTFLYSNGPKFLTVVKKEPNVPEVK